MKNVILNDEQESVLTALIDFVKPTNKQQFIAFAAPAGTGKTTVVTKFVEALNPLSSIVICSPTHKALSILKKNKLSDRSDYMTIYALLGLVPVSSADTKVISKKGKSKLENYSVVVIDEASMLSSIVVRFIHGALKELESKGKFVKIIYVGDSFQLPPVNENNSPALNIDNAVTLSKVMRSEDNVLSLCTQIREYISQGYVPNYSDFHNCVDDNGNGVRIVNKADFMNGIIDDFTKPIDNRDAIRIVTYMNASVENYNGVIREANGLDRNVRYYPGELIMAKEPITVIQCDLTYHIRETLPRGSDDILFSIATEFKIIDVQLGKSVEWLESESIRTRIPMYPFTIHTYAITGVPLDVDDCDEPITFLIPVDYDYYNRVKKDIVPAIKSALSKISADGIVLNNRDTWSIFYRLRDFVATPQSLFALTSHSAQGSSFEKVYVDVGNILSMAKYDKDSALRSLYVAVSRASKNVILTF